MTAEAKTGLTIKDLETLQTTHPDWKMELVGGEIIVMSPSGYKFGQGRSGDCGSAMNVG